MTEVTIKESCPACGAPMEFTAFVGLLVEWQKQAVSFAEFYCHVCGDTYWLDPAVIPALQSWLDGEGYLYFEIDAGDGSSGLVAGR